MGCCQQGLGELARLWQALLSFVHWRAHNPERWGLLQFSSSPKDAWPAAPVRYAEWPSRSAAMAVYAAQHACLDATGAFAPSAAALVPFSTPPFELCPGADVAIELSDDQGKLTATVICCSAAPPFFFLVLLPLRPRGK